MKTLVTLLLISIVMCAPCLADEAADNIKVVEAMTTAINDRDLDALKNFVAADVKRHSNSTPGVNVSSLEEFIEFLKADLAVCPDAMQEIEIIFGAGDKVALRAMYRGTQTG